MKKPINLNGFCKELSRARGSKQITKLISKLPFHDERLIKINRGLCELIIRKREQIKKQKITKFEKKQGFTPYSFDKTKTISQHVKEYFNLDYRTYTKLIKLGCSICDFKKNIHLHHIVPKSKGGTNDISNLIPLCRKCHEEKHPHMKKTKPPM